MRSFLGGRWVVLALAVGSLTSCLQTRSETSEQEEKQQVMSQVSTLQKVKADQQATIDELSENLRVTNGRVEALEARLQKSQEELAQVQNVAKTRQEEWISQSRHLEEEIASLKDGLAKAQAASAAAATPNLSAAAGPGSESEKSSWDEADGLFTKKDYRRAATALQRYRDKYPKGKKLAEATYRIGICFQELGMPTEAKAFFGEVVEKHPRDPVAKKASFRLSQLKR